MSVQYEVVGERNIFFKNRPFFYEKLFEFKFIVFFVYIYFYKKVNKNNEFNININNKFS